MAYELEFIGLNKENTKDADAICFRYYKESLNKYVVCVYDGGTSDYGEELKNHLSKYYFQETDDPLIDYVICSHSDLDHASGLSIILENFKVGCLIMNRPWLYVDDLFDKVDDGRITKQSLEKQLREKYPYINKLEEIAIEYEIEIIEGFEGFKISDELVILSPSKEFYLELLVESNKTPLSENSQNESFIQKTFNIIKSAIESWTRELIREDVSTSAENEMCIIIHGTMDSEQFLLTGDSGIRALEKAIEYSEHISISLTDVKVHQIPHHGGRHNVSPSILNKLVGPIVEENSKLEKVAIVSVSKGSDHPRKMVTNAYLRRGFSVYEARTGTLRHNVNTPEREGWTPAININFSEEVENWDN